MARGQLNSRGDANDRESFSSCLGISEGIPGGSGSTSSMEMGRDPITFGCSRVEGEPVALLVSSRPTSLSRTTARPEQDVGVPERDHVGRRGFGEPSAGDTMAYAANVETIGRGGADASWNSTMLSHHRRCSSAPNFLSSWRGAGLPSLSSGVLAPRLRDHTIPEGRRFEAVEPPLQSTIAPARPRSWGVGSTARAWCVGPVDFGTRELLNSGPMDLAPKVRASYFVNVRGGQGEMPTTSRSTSVNGLMSQSSTIAGMTATDSRPFEEIKRMRLSQALESGGGSGGPQQQHQDAFGMLRLTPSPTYSTSGRGPHFDTARLAQRFSPGKGVKVSGFPASSLNGRSAAFGGGPGGVVFGPLSPALTEPPTPPSHWKFQEPEAFPTNAGDADGGSGHAQAAQQAAAESSSSQQGVLPMEKRPIDEVSAVQALMSVGLGKGATSLTSVDEEPAACPAAAAVGGVPQQAGVHGCSSATVTSVDMGAFKAARSPLPSLERLKPFEGGCDDDDDGLDKDLWVVVEKGSMCASSDCVYRDPMARIASRRHYHAKCAHTHNGGEKKGMVFHHHQLEKVQKHQRSHKREATKSAPYKRTTPEDHQAMEAAGVEGYRPADWSPEETRQLDELVNQLVAPVTHAWPSIARFFPTKTSIQCLLHWRFTLNDNGIIRGNGTWGAEEDERLRKLAPVFSSPSTGPRWAKIAEVMPGRTAKQCRERYNNHVDPGIKKDKIWSAEEDALVMQLHAEHHNQFAKIARSIPGRCYDDVKNRFNLLVKRRLAGKSPSSGPAGPANKSPRPEVEHSKTGGRSPPTFECTATAGLLRNHPGGAAQTPGASPGGM